MKKIQVVWSGRQLVIGIVATSMCVVIATLKGGVLGAISAAVVLVVAIMGRKVGGTDGNNY